MYNVSCYFTIKEIYKVKVEEYGHFCFTNTEIMNSTQHAFLHLQSIDNDEVTIDQRVFQENVTLGSTDKSLDGLGSHGNHSDLGGYHGDDVVDTVYGVICMVLVPLICTGNILVVVALFKFRKLRTNTNILIGNLSVADFLMGAMIVPTYGGFYFNRQNLEKNKWLCLFKYSSVTCSSSASLLSLVAIAVDRYIAILHPLSYSRLVTTSRIKKVICGLWMYEIFKAILPFVWNYYDTYKQCDYFKAIPQFYTITFSFVSLALALVVALYMYIRVFVAANKQRNRLAEETSVFSKEEGKKFERETRSAKIMALVMLLFYIFWLPFLFVGPLRYLRLRQKLIEHLKNGAMIVAMSNSMVNPIVYCWMRTDFRRAFYRMCCGAWHGQVGLTNPSNELANSSQSDASQGRGTAKTFLLASGFSKDGECAC